MSSADKYTWTRQDGRKLTRWRARWIGPDGKDRSKRGFDRKADAESYAADRETEARHGVTLTGERPSGRTTVEVWTATWLAAQEVRPSTAEAYKYALARINSTLGTRSLASLRPTELRSWRKALANSYAESTAAQTAATLAMVLRAAVHDGLIDRSPMPPQKHGAVGNVVDPDELLSLDQVHAWGRGFEPLPHPHSKNVQPPVAVEMPLTAAQTGARLGELLGLRLDDVDFLRREIRIDHQLLPSGLYGPPKTAAAVRTIPLTADVAAAINRHLLVQPPEKGEPIFRGPRGRRWNRRSFHEAWTIAKDRAELPAWVHWHALRDVYASSLIRTGMDLRTVMTLVGHTSSEETLRVYARIWPDAQDRAREALEGVWAPADSESDGHETSTDR